MAVGNNPRKKPLGNRIRDLINPALEDDRCKQIQLDILDRYFQQVVIQFPGIMEKQFKLIFNQASSLPSQDKNPFVVSKLTSVDSRTGETPYSPIMPLGVQICPDFTSFSADDIKALPAYINLHEVARAENVAIKLVGLTADEVKSGLQARLIIDGSKTYEQGAMENALLYPNLPPLPPAFDRDTPKHFRFGS